MTRRRPAALLPRRQGGQQGLGIGMLGPREQLRGSGPLGDAAGIHHRHPIAGLRDDAEVMGDQQDAHGEFAPQIEQQLEDLVLDGDVQRRRRLVGDEQLGPAGKGHGDHHPLPHAAGEFMRPGVHPPCRRGHADPLQAGGWSSARTCCRSKS